VTYGIIAAGLWPQIAYCMILYLTGLNNVDPEQIEAARLDGAKGWKMLWYIILPQLRPATFIAVVVTVIGALRSFDLVSIMTDGGPFGSSRVLSFYMFEQALSEYGYRMGYGAAIAVVLFAIMMVFISGFIWKMCPTTKGACDVSTPIERTVPRPRSVPGGAADCADPLAAAAHRRGDDLVKPASDLAAGNYFGLPS
jgi:multiple sugar transport system permease protein